MVGSSLGWQRRECVRDSTSLSLKALFYCASDRTFPFSSAHLEISFFVAAGQWLLLLLPPLTSECGSHRKVLFGDP